MIAFRPLLLAASLAAGTLGLALPAAGGTLAPQLRTLAASYHQAPRATIKRLARTTASTPRFLAPRVSAAGKVQVYIHYRAGQLPSHAALAGIGASGVFVSRPLGVVQAWLPIARLNAAAALAGVSQVSVPVYGRAKTPFGTQPATDACNPVSSGLAIDNEGIAAENVGPVQAQGVTGSGVKVGVISDGADCIASSQAAGYLPSNVWIDPTLSGSGDEGTALLEEVHAMAPGAALGFCGPETTVDFLQCLDDFATWGANVISDDLGFIPVSYNLDFFEATDGGDAITEFAQAHPDITLTTAAGNDGYDYYEADYSANTDPSSPSGPPISLSPTYTVGGPLSDYEAANRSYGSAMDFGAALGQASDAALEVQVASGATLYGDLTWNDPAAGPYDDLDLFLIKPDGSEACQPAGDDSEWCSSTLDQMTYAGDPDVELPPFEFLTYTNNGGSTQTLYLVALCYDCGAHGNQPLHVKLYGLANGGALFNYVTYGGVNGHATLAVEFTTAAAQYSGRGVNSTIENYSDTGPFNYGDWASGTQTRAKPDITGTDCTTISGAGGFGNPFCGTSAASPNVGAVVALARGFAPSGEPDAAGWKQLVMDNANPGALTNYIVNAGGAGLVDAAAAVSSLAPSNITATITSPAKSPFKVDPNTSIQFAATCDYDGNETPAYKWTFGGDSGIPDSTQLTPDPVQYAKGGVYTVTFTCSAGGESGSDSVTAEVQAAATANDQSLDTGHNQKLSGQLTGTGIGGESVSFTLVKNAGHGTAQVAADGSFTYTPGKGFSGKDFFQFQIDNGVQKSNTATVTIEVAKGSPPTASDGTLTVKENKSASGVLQATDPDGDPLTFSIVSQPTHGSLTLDDASSGAYTYTPEHGYSGSDSFTFKANDGSADSNTAKVSITVAKVSGGGGGGAFGGLGLTLLGGLAGLLLFLRRKR